MIDVGSNLRVTETLVNVNRLLSRLRVNKRRGLKRSLFVFAIVVVWKRVRITSDVLFFSAIVGR